MHRHGRRQAERLTNAINRITQHNLEQIVADAQQWSPGIRAATYNPKVTGTPTPGTPLDRPPEPDWYQQINDRIDHAINALNTLDTLCRTLTRANPTERQPSTAHCQSCERIIGTSTHPAKAGMCEACNKWVTRERHRIIATGAHPPDRAELIHTRRLMLANQDTRQRDTHPLGT